jgi:hypothetical protein
MNMLSDNPDIIADLQLNMGIFRDTHNLIILHRELLALKTTYINARKTKAS